MGLVVIGLAAFAQQANPEMIFTVVEQAPEFPGGTQALKKYLAINVRYPESAARAKVSGKLFVSLVVEPDGQLTQIMVVDGLGFGCDEEAIRVVKAMPRWQPGTQSGRALRVKYTLRVMFGIK